MTYDRAWQQTEAPDQPTESDWADLEMWDEEEAAAEEFAMMCEAADAAADERGYFAAQDAEERESDAYYAEYGW